MAGNEIPKVRWRATNAISLQQDYEPGNISLTLNSEVPVQETSKSVDMEAKPEENAYGMPITAELAVALIADLQSRMSSICEHINHLTFTENFQEDDYKWLRNLLVHSSAITIDKNVILKTLSQPGCEGVRFYLCRKTIKRNDKDEPFLSLVTVGVDAKGQDLFYQYIPNKLSQGLKEAELENTSFISEYGSPPPPYNLTKNEFTEYDNRFAILRYALDEANNIKKFNAKP